jgi:hypothetical protein
VRSVGGELGRLREVEIPAGEVSLGRTPFRARGRRRFAILISVSAAIGAIAIAKLAFGVDIVELIGDAFMSR